MPNLRIVYDNAVTRNATMTASTSASASLGVSNLLTDIKSDVWRSTGTSATLTLTWAASQLIGCVALPFCNLTATATIRVRGYTNTADASPVIDSGVVIACANAALGYWDWGSLPLGVNAFSYGGGAYGRVWITPSSVKKIVIDIVNTSPATYIEASKLVVGGYWEATRNPDAVSVQPTDSSTHYRNQAGDLLTDLGSSSRTLNINLVNMPPEDRARMYAMARVNGKTGPILISVFPNSDDPELEQAHQMWGKLSDINPISMPNYQLYATTLDIEEI